VLEYTNIFHTLFINMGIEDSWWNMVIKYYSGLHRYIQTDMEFPYISSLGVTYQYVVKIKKNFKQKNKRDFSSSNPSQHKHTKVVPNSHRKEYRKDVQHKKNTPSHKEIRIIGSQRRTLESGASSKKSIGTTLINVAPNSHCLLRQNPHIWMLTMTLI
jgi:hypothetical protein